MILNYSGGFDHENEGGVYQVLGLAVKTRIT